MRGEYTEKREAVEERSGKSRKGVWEEKKRSEEKERNGKRKTGRGKWE